MPKTICDGGTIFSKPAIDIGVGGVVIKALQLGEDPARRNLGDVFAGPGEKRDAAGHHWHHPAAVRKQPTDVAQPRQAPAQQEAGDRAAAVVGKLENPPAARPS